MRKEHESVLDVYRDLFAALNAAKVRYAVFKGHSHLDADLSGDNGDVDVWFAPADMGRALEIARDAGFFSVRGDSSRRVAFFRVGWDLPTGRRASLHVHRRPFARRKRTVVPLMFVYLRDVETGPRHKATGATLSPDAWAQRFEDDRKALLRRSTLALAADAMFRPSRMRETGFRLSWVETFRTYAALASHLVGHRGRNPVARRGVLVAFSGVDGSGKSTLIDTLVGSRFLSTTQGVERRYFGNREFWIPGLARAVQRERRGRIGAMAVMGLAIIDRKLRVVPALAARRRGKVVLCDRYYFDHRVGDPTAKHLGRGVVKRIADAVVRWVPARPDLAVYLQVSAAKAHSRKPDKSVAELKVSIAGYDAVFEDWSGTMFVNADQPADAVATEVRAAIAARLRANQGGKR